MLSYNPIPPFLKNREIETSLHRVRLQKCKKNILIVDDDKEIGQLLRGVLEVDSNIEVDIAYNSSEAIERLRNKYYHMVVLDWNLPDSKGMEALIATEKHYHLNVPFNLDERKRVKVVTFSADNLEPSITYSTPHFRVLGHIQKRNSLSNIVQRVFFYLNQPMGIAS